jgi:hypothetical protein
MYLVKYTMLIGANEHYAPSAMAAMSLIRDIHVGGGRLASITRTRDGISLTFSELEELAQVEVGPRDDRPRNFASALRRVLTWSDEA